MKSYVSYIYVEVKLSVDYKERLELYKLKGRNSSVTIQYKAYLGQFHLLRVIKIIISNKQ